jgi:translocation and assembly module TamB
VEAVRTVDEIVAGVNVRGTLHAPRLALFSEPPMDQAQVLAYLLTGHALSTTGTSRADASMLLQAAGGLAGGDAITERLRTTLGLEAVDIRSGKTPTDTALVLGKYLSPRLYVSYGLGLFDRTSTLHLRYKLGAHWTLETESGTGVGTDLLYTIEVK